MLHHEGPRAPVCLPSVPLHLHHSSCLLHNDFSDYAREDEGRRRVSLPRARVTHLSSPRARFSFALVAFAHNNAIPYSSSIAVPSSSSIDPLRNAFHPSGFTPINRQSTHPVTQQPSRIQRNAENAERVRERNPVVAKQLGLDGLEEPTHLKIYASRLPTARDCPSRKRKRIRSDQKHPNAKSITEQKTQKADDGQAWNRSSSSTNLRVTTPASIPSLLDEDTLVVLPRLEPSRYNNSVKKMHGTAPTGVKSSDNSKGLPNFEACYVTAEAETEMNRTSNACQSARNLRNPVRAFTYDCHVNNETNNQFLQDNTALSHQTSKAISDTDSAFDDNLDDNDLLMLTSDLADTFTNINNSGRSPSKTVFENENDTQGQQSLTVRRSDTLVSSSSRGPACHFVSPITPKFTTLNQNTRINTPGSHKPIVRSPFPSPTRDCSPVIGLSSDTLLRTCFRIGEAISQASYATKSDQSVVFELYARVLKSERDNTKQQFVLCDLFHTRPPYIEAIYHAAVWKSVPLFSNESKQLLQPKKACRCMGTIRREGRQWCMVVLNVWEATWDDISWVEDIVNS